jgi:hypothetical protein
LGVIEATYGNIITSQAPRRIKGILCDVGMFKPQIPRLRLRMLAKERPDNYSRSALDYRINTNK